MDLVRRINSTYTQVDRNLQILEKEEIIMVRSVGRLRMVRLNWENPRTEIILKALRMLSSAEAKPTRRSE